MSKDSVRSSLGRDKSKFIYFGRTSTYALKQWEEEKNNIKGGTIRDIVEDYLQQHSEPEHISLIAEHVLKYRPDTYERSVLDNLKADNGKRFIFYRNCNVGLKNKIYNNKYIKLSGRMVTWEERFNLLKNFRNTNGDWPKASSISRNEKALYLFGYKARKKYLSGDLEIEKISLLKSINFPLEEAKSNRI